MSRPRWTFTVPTRHAVAVGLVTCLVALPLVAFATIETGVNGEAVDQYFNSACHLFSTIVCIAEMDNFRNGMIEPIHSIYTGGSRFAGPSVFDTDFTDPDATHDSRDADTVNFDTAGSSIGYVSLHGSAADFTEQTCTHTSQCTNPPAGMRNPGVCVGPGPNNGTNGWCSYLIDKTLITSSCGNTGTKYNGVIDYTSGVVKLGETPMTGTWAGAGTNGGLQFAAIVNSVGLRFGLIQQEVLPIFAGTPTIGMVMPTTPGHYPNGQFADDYDAPDRGTAFANAYVSNPNGSVGAAWVDSIVGIAYNEGHPCGGSYTTYGGGHGIDYCGAQTTIALDSNSTNAFWDRDTKDWIETQNTAWGATSFGWWTYRWHCNYDCNTFPINLN